MARILVVDDDPAVQDLLRAWLARAGHDVRLAGDGPAGLRTAREFRPDLVLLDRVMPRTSGDDVCRRLRSDDRYRDTRVVLMSVRTSLADQQQGYLLGADDYIGKPFRPAEVVSLLGRTLAA